MNIMATTILLGFVTISIILLIVAIFVLIEATHELTNAINGLREMHKGKPRGNEVKFIGPGFKSLPFGKSPKGRRGRKNWGIH